MSAPVTGRWRHEKQGQFWGFGWRIGAGSGSFCAINLKDSTAGCWTKRKILSWHVNIFHMAETERGK